jgi:tRNA1(Val) A37 N6-methylase TrmN6
VFHSTAKGGQGGFDVVIGNPPYVFAGESKNKGITAEDKKYYYKHYEMAEYQVNLYPSDFSSSKSLTAIFS